jgi:colicin import membrane protein
MSVMELIAARKAAAEKLAAEEEATIPPEVKAQLAAEEAERVRVEAEKAAEQLKEEERRRKEEAAKSAVGTRAVRPYDSKTRVKLAQRLVEMQQVWGGS